MRALFALVCLCTLALSADEPQLVIDSGGHQATINFIKFTKDTKYLVSAGEDKTIRIWDVAAGKVTRIIRGQIEDGSEGKIYAAAMSPDGRSLAVAGWLSPFGGSEIIRVHDLRTGEVTRVLREDHTGAIHALAFSHDGKYIASGGEDRIIRVWNLEKGTIAHALAGHKSNIYSLAFSPDDRMLVSASADKTLRLWSVKSGDLLKDMTGSEGAVLSVTFSEDGRYIASGDSAGGVLLWNGTNGDFATHLAKVENEVGDLSFSPDSKMLLAGFGVTLSPHSTPLSFCRVFEVRSGRVAATFTGHQNVVHASAFASESLVATAGGDDNEIDLWNPNNGQLAKKLVGAGQNIWSLGFAKDGRSVAFGTSRNTTRQRNNGKLEKVIVLNRPHTPGISIESTLQSEEEYVRERREVGNVRITSRDGNTPETGVLGIFRAGLLERQIGRDAASGYRHNSYSLSPDGTQIASGGSNGFLSIYSRSIGITSSQCVGHTAEVWAVAFSPDGKTLVSGSADQTIRFWDVSSSSCRSILTIFVGTDNEWVAWTPQGYYTASASGDKYIGWHVNQGLDQQAKYYPASTFQKQFYRPDIVSEFLRTRDIALAVRTANETRGGDLRTETAVLGPADIMRTPPPHILIANPLENQATVSDPTYRVVAFAVSDLPITRFELLVNGASFAGGGTPAKLKGSPTERELEAEVPLTPGENQLSFIASNSKADSPPKTRLVTYAPRPGAAFTKLEKPKLILLSIGISKYEHPTFRLDYADNDALEIEKIFLTQKGHLYSNVIPKHLVNAEATKDNILDALHWLNDQGTDSDIRLVFLSGHGGLDSYGNYYFYSVNHDPFRDPESRDVRWETLIERLTSPKRKAVLIVDSCHAAAVSGAPKPRGDVDFERVLHDMNSKFRGLFTLAASMGTESSLESKDWQHGAFTKALLDELRNKNDQGKVLTTDDITAKVKDAVKILTHDEQHPKATYSETLTEFPIFWIGGGG